MPEKKEDGFCLLLPLPRHSASLARLLLSLQHFRQTLYIKAVHYFLLHPDSASRATLFLSLSCPRGDGQPAVSHEG